jgi:hypothetical protein
MRRRTSVCRLPFDGLRDAREPHRDVLHFLLKHDAMMLRVVALGLGDRNAERVGATTICATPVTDVLRNPAALLAARLHDSASAQTARGYSGQRFCLACFGGRRSTGEYGRRNAKGVPSR